MGCKIRHRWQLINRVRIWNRQELNYGCSKCPATKTELRRIGDQPSVIDSKAFHILQLVAMMALMWAMLFRLFNWWNYERVAPPSDTDTTSAPLDTGDAPVILNL